MDKLNQWLNLFASLGVMAGLVFLVIELNQNTQATIAAASAELTNQSLEYFSAGMDNQVISRALHKQRAGEPLDGLEQDQLRMHQYFNFRVFENAFHQYQRGFFDESEWQKYRRIIARLLHNNDLASQMWNESDGQWTDDFSTEVNGLRNRLEGAIP